MKINGSHKLSYADIELSLRKLKTLATSNEMSELYNELTRAQKAYHDDIHERAKDMSFKELKRAIKEDIAKYGEDYFSIKIYMGYDKDSNGIISENT